MLTSKLWNLFWPSTKSFMYWHVCRKINFTLPFRKWNYANVINEVFASYHCKLFITQEIGFYCSLQLVIKLQSCDTKMHYVCYLNYDLVWHLAQARSLMCGWFKVHDNINYASSVSVFAETKYYKSTDKTRTKDFAIIYLHAFANDRSLIKFSTRWVLYYHKTLFVQEC